MNLHSIVQVRHFQNIRNKYNLNVYYKMFEVHSLIKNGKNGPISHSIIHQQRYSQSRQKVSGEHAPIL